MDWENNFYLCQAFLKRCDEELLKIEKEIKERNNLFQTRKNREQVLQTYLNSLNEDKKDYIDYNALKEKKEQLNRWKKSTFIGSLVLILISGIASSYIVCLLGGLSFVASSVFNIMSKKMNQMITSHKDFSDNSEEDYNEQIALVQKEIEDNQKDMTMDTDRVTHLNNDKKAIMEGKMKMQEHIKRAFPYTNTNSDSIEKRVPVKREDNPLIKINTYRRGRNK